MIAGLIAVFIVIAVIPMAANEGNTGAVIVLVFAALLLILFGISCRVRVKARNNYINYWANGGPNRTGRSARGKRVQEQERTWEPCPSCGGRLGFVSLVNDRSGTKCLYSCTRCAKKFTWII